MGTWGFHPCQAGQVSRSSAFQLSWFGGDNRVSYQQIKEVVNELQWVFIKGSEVLGGAQEASSYVICEAASQL